MRTLRWLTVFLGMLPMAVRAEAPAWWPQESVVQVTVERPGLALSHPIVRDVTAAVVNSPAFQVEQRSVDRLKLNQAKELVETSLGQSWPTSVDTLVVRGWFGVGLPTGLFGQQPEAITVIESRDAEALKKLLDAGRDILARQDPPVVPQARQTNGREWFRVGNAAYAQVGRYLLSATPDSALDKLLAKADSLPAAAPLPEIARAEVNVNLAKVRALPQFANLKWPTDNGGLVTIAGGYADLLRRANTVTANLTFEGDAIALRIEADAGTDGMPAGLAGFFTTGESPAPLLQIPEVMASASWVRDYAPLWTHRTELITASALETAEKQYDKVRERDGFGVDEVTAWLGTRWRFVVARQSETVYREQPLERLPAAALAVSLRNETAFTANVFKALDKYARGPITLVFGYPKNTEYGGAKITSVRIKEPENAAETVDYRYSVSPAMTVAHGHFIVGSTEQIVHQVIDELARQSPAETPAFEPGTTDVQRYSFRDAARLVGEFRETILRRIVLEGGLTVSEAEQNTAMAASLLERLGELRSQTVVTGNAFRTELRLGR